MATLIDSIKAFITEAIIEEDKRVELLSDLIVAEMNVNTLRLPSGHLVNTPIPKESKKIETALLNRFKTKAKHDITKDDRIRRVYNWLYMKEPFTDASICSDIAIKFAIDVLDQVFDSDSFYPFATRQDAEELFIAEGSKNGIWRLSGSLPLTLILTARNYKAPGINHYAIPLREIFTERDSVDGAVDHYAKRVCPVKYDSNKIDETKAKRRKTQDSNTQ